MNLVDSRVGRIDPTILPTLKGEDDVNIPQVVENFTVAEEQLAENGDHRTIIEQARDIVGLQAKDFEALFTQGVSDGLLPPGPQVPTTATDVVSALLTGVLIGLRAVQLTELSELEDIPTL